MKVRATQDGHFGGYFRVGPIINDDGTFAGEVFEIPDGEFPVPLFTESGDPVLDSKTGKPMFQTITVKDPKTGKDIEKIKTFSWFADSWMERVPEETENTYDYPPFELPVAYRKKKVAKGPVIDRPLASAGVI